MGKNALEKCGKEATESCSLVDSPNLEICRHRNLVPVKHTFVLVIQDYDGKTITGKPSGGFAL